MNKTITISALILFIITQSVTASDVVPDGKINLNDSIYMLQSLAGIRLEPSNLYSLSDAICILKFMAGIDGFIDSDQDGVTDCKDSCPDDPAKIAPGDCGCSAIEVKNKNGDIECFQRVWSDEFNDTALSPKNWRFETGGTGWGNRELQFYTDRTENVRLENGRLNITARQEDYHGKQWTSGRISTAGNHSFKYGLIQARLRLPHGTGIWPAFWMLGNSFFKNGWPACGEFDIVESGSKADIESGLNDRTVHAAAHWADDAGIHFDPVPTGKIVSDKPLDEDFHIFGIRWDDNEFTAFMDNQDYFTFDLKSYDSTEEFHEPFFLVMNLAIGGYYTGITEENKGLITSDFPQVLAADWVRVYQKQGQEYIKGNPSCSIPPSGGDFIIYKDWTNNSNIAGRILIDVNAAVWVWNNLTPCQIQNPVEGINSLCFTGNAGNWSGFGIESGFSWDLSAYADDHLHVAMKTSSTESFKIGIKSGYQPGQGESWIPFNAGSDPYGFARDGNWHTLLIPMSDFKNTDYSQMSQFFMLSTGTLASDFTIEIDDMYFVDNEMCSDRLSRK